MTPKKATCYQCGATLGHMASECLDQCRACYKERWHYVKSEVFVNAFKFFNAKAPLESDDGLFLDVGCGAGNILHAVSVIQRYGLSPTVFSRIYGVEISPELARTARLVDDQINVRTVDALSSDSDLLKAYKTADLIHMYRPLKKDDAQAKLETHVVSNMKAGAILMIRYESPSLAKNKKIRLLFNAHAYNFYQKK